MARGLEFEAEGEDEAVVGVFELGVGAEGGVLCQGVFGRAVVGSWRGGEGVPFVGLGGVDVGGVEIYEAEVVAKSEREVLAVAVELVD